MQRLGSDTRTKGIPTEQEISEILSLNLDPRFRCAIMLGAVCGLRLGEIPALKINSIKGNTLQISSSWSKIEGLKETKTGKVRIIPLPDIIRDSFMTLANNNPHGQQGFVICGLDEDAPLDCRAIERGFDKALMQLSLGEKFEIGTKEEKKAALAAWRTRNITFHSLRHFADAQLRGAVPDETLRKLIGHSSAEMTDHYDHATAADLEAIARAQKARILPFIKSA